MERTYRPDKNSYRELLELIKKKKPAALATIIEAHGSTPQVEGASAVFTPEGLTCGTIGGGLVEAEVQRKAKSAIARGKSGLFDFNLAGEATQSDRAICGGRLKVLVEVQPELNEAAFRALKQALKRRKSGVLATVIRKNSTTRRLDVGRFWVDADFQSNELRGSPLAGLEANIRRTLLDKKPSLSRGKPGMIYLEPHFPLPQLLVVGAGHIGQAVGHLGKLLDFEIIVVDDRAEYANRKRFPKADRIVVADIGDAVRDFPVSSETYIVIVTRGHARDEEALRACIKRMAGYIGMIGSRRKIGLMKEKFIRRGWASAADFAAVYSPIGIAINSKTVQEIAVSIAAELVLVRSRKRERQGGQG